jgi:formate hydrogenlyase transcriptional activator
LPQDSRYITLLEVSRALASHSTLNDLMHELNVRLHEVLNFNYLSLLLHDPRENRMRIHTAETPSQSNLLAGTLVQADSPGLEVWRSQQCIVVADVSRETRFLSACTILAEHNVGSYCTIPLTTPRRRLGAMTIGSAETNTYSPDRLELPQLVAQQVAIAVENSLNQQEAQEAHEQLTRERDRLKLLLQVTSAAVSHLALSEVYQTIPSCVRQAMQCHAAFLSLVEPDGKHLRFRGLDFPSSIGAIYEGMVLPIDGTTPGIAYRTGQPYLYGTLPQNLAPPVLALTRAENIESGCFIPVTRDERKIGVLHLLDRRRDFFHPDDVEFLRQLASQIAIALDNAIRFQEMVEARTQYQEEARYLRQELRSEPGFGDEAREILGDSAAIHRTLSQIRIVAPTDSTVLILGETGTGKELAARAIHNLSNRRDHSFIKLNCAAIPLGLLESELFGHERGAFTGAIAQKVGRFELANKGTLFLDEIGDIPLELQAKLLRVLQEQEFERLGSNKTIRVNVRLVAATNRDLTKMVEEREFRADLYYRLNVFPIPLAPLRERKEDIPVLIYHFLAKYAKSLNKRIDNIPADVIRVMREYSWPGNVRELQNFIERAVILTQNNVLNAPLSELLAVQPQPASPVTTVSNSTQTLEAAEREHILRTLEETNWVLSGAKGAASRLGVPRTTLLYRMKRLRIQRTNA